MANNLIQVKRTSVSGRAANSTTLPNPGELALNMTDGILYSTNGSAVFEIGANNTNARVSGTLTVNAVSANGGVGTNNQVLTSNGSKAYWKDNIIKDLADVAANGATDTQVLTYNSTLNKWINQNPPVANVIYTTGYYGVFYDNSVSQYATGGNNAATVLRFNSSYLTNGITLTANNELQIGYAGVYQFTYSVQFESSSNKVENVKVWLRKNGTDVPNSGSDFGVYDEVGVANGVLVAVTPLIESASAGDKFQIIWSTSSNTHVAVTSFPATANAPLIPAAIATVIPISNIITAPPGGNTDITFNDSGLANGASGFTFNKTTNSVFVANNLNVSNTVNAAAFTVDNQFWANSTVVNSTTFQVGSSFTANSTLVNAAALLIRGVATVNNSLTVNSTTINASGMYTTNVTGNLTGNVVATNVNAATIQVSTSFTLDNDKNLQWKAKNTSTVVGMRQQSDDNFVFYSTDATYAARPVFAIYANSSTSNLQMLVPLNLASKLGANGSFGTSGQVLTTNGSGVYWSAAGSGSVDVNAQYAWTNTHTFSANVSFTGNGIGIASNTGAIYLGGIGDANWKIARNAGVSTKWKYTNNTIDIVTANSNLEGMTIGLVNGNSYFETGYLGTFIASNVTVGNSTSNISINSTAFVGNVVATSISGNLTGNIAATTISGNLTGNVTATTISGNLTGNVTATTVSSSANVSVGNSTVNVYANTTAFVGNTVGVHTGNVVATTISGNLTGNVVATTITGNLTGNVVATTITGNLTGNVSATTVAASANITVGANVLITTANLAIGNSTANVFVNSTAFVGNTVGVHTGNVAATTISGNLTGNVVATTITGNLTGNVSATTISGNLTGNVVATTVNASANVYVGNSSVFVYANSTAFVGNVVSTAISGNLTGNVAATTITGNLTGNVAATTISGNLSGNVVATTITGNLTGNVVAGTVNATTINATSSIVVGANVSLNTSVLSIGNSTANVFVNSTAYVGNVVATTITGNLTGNVVATNISGNLTGNVLATTLSGNLTAITANVTNKLQIGTPGSFDFGSNAVIEIDANGNTYVQSVIQNANTGNNASADLVVTNDTGNDSFNYVDLGINGSNYNQPGFNITGQNDAYLYASHGNLAIGTAAASKEIIFHAGGTTTSDRRLTVNSTAVIIANAAALVANGSTGTAGQILTSNSTGAYWSSSANNALNLGGVAAASYQLNSTLNANVAAYLPTYTGVVNASTFQVGTAFKANTTDVVTANLTVQGNLIVTGTTVTLNTATLDVKDLNITLAKGTASAAAANGAGITVDAAFAEIIYINASNTWLSNINLGVGNSTSNVSINSTAFIGNVVATTITGNLTGNVAATTISASANLTVGSLLVANSTVVNATHLAGVAGASYVQNTDSRTLSGNLVFAGSNTTVNAVFRVVNSTANVLFAGANGNIGIGTTAPAFLLDVSGNMRATNYVYGDAAVISPLLTYNGAGDLTVTHGGNYSIKFVTNGSSEKMRIAANGNVGIGTDTPAYPLQVRRAGGAGSLGITVDNVFSGSDRTIKYLSVGDSGTDTSGHAFYSRNGSTTDIGSLYITPSGNVGIGTSSASAKLHVQGTTLFRSTGAAVTIDSASATDARMEFLYNGTRSGFISVDNSTLSIIANSAAALILGANAQEYMRIAANGNIGIGTSTPANKLHVGGTSYFAGATTFLTGTWHTSTDGKNRFYYGSNSRTYFGTNDGYEFRDSSDVAIVHITNGGNVGIANTTPDAKLAVTGTANVSGNARIGGTLTAVANVVLGTTTITANGGVGTAGQVLTSGATGNVYWATPTVGDITAVTAGDGLTGGGTSGDVTLNVVAGNGITAAADAISVTQGTGVVVNATGVHVNASYIATISANTATYLNSATNFGNSAGITAPAFYDSSNTTFVVDPASTTRLSTVNIDNLGWNSTVPQFGQRSAYINEFVDILYQADKRFTLTNGSQYYFDGDFGSSVVIPVNTTRVININIAGQAGIPGTGITYCSGVILVSFYYTSNLYSSLSLRVRNSAGTWTSAAAPTNISTNASYKVMAFTVPIGNYLTDIELTVVTDATNEVWLAGINYYTDRWTTELELPYASKYLNTNYFFGSFGVKNNSGVINNLLSGTSNSYLAATVGNLGVGTTTPARKLDVYGSGQFSDASGIQTTIWSQATSGTGGVGTNNDYPFTILANGTEHVRITSTGNVGIGTTTPSEKFAVNGRGFFNSGVRLGTGYSALDVATGASGLYLSGSQSALNHVFISPSGNVGIGNTTPAHTLSVNGPTNLAGAVTGITTLAAGNSTITGFANVSVSVNSALYTIGTTVVANTTGTYATHLAGVAGASYVQNTDSRTLSGNLVFSGSNTTINAVFRVVNSTANVFFAAANGNVGIGTVVPNALLTLDATSPRLSFYPSDSNYALYRSSTSMVLNSPGYTEVSSVSGTALTTTTGAIGFNTGTAGTASERMRVAANGNVGIGTASPQAVLDLGAATNGRAITWGSDGAGRYASIFTPYSSSGLVLAGGFHGNTTADAYISSHTGTYYNNGIRINTFGAEGIQFFADASAAKTAGAAFVPTERMRITAAGDVGIGTTAPSSKVQVVTSSGAAPINSVGSGALRLRSSTSAAVGVGPSIIFEGKTNNTTTDYGFGAIQGFKSSATADDYSGSLAFYTQLGGGATAFSERMRITNAGVIIGDGETSATPVNALIEATDGSGTNIAGASFTIQGGRGTGTAAGGSIILSTSNASATSGTTLNAATERMRITSDGDVAIGGTTSTGYSASYASLVVGSTSKIGLIKLRSGYNSGNGAEIFQLNGGTTYFNTNSAGTWMVSDASGNVGIGTTTTSYKLTVNGQASFNGVPLSSAANYDELTYFSLQKHLENDNTNCLIGGGTNPTFANTNNTTTPFSKIASFPAYYEGISEFIPVQPGERLYGEIYALRETGSTGTAGQLYVGIARYDKDKKPIATNLGLTYFISGGSGVAVPQDSVWNKYSGYNTLPTSHTIFDGSDGGPVRYIRAYIIVNYNAGTIPTKIGGFTIRKVSAVKDTGDFAVLGNLGVGTTTPAAKLDAYSASGWSGVFSGSGSRYVGIAADSAAVATDIHWDNGSPLRFSVGTSRAAAGYTELMRISPTGNVGIGTTSPAAKLQVNGEIRSTDGTTSVKMITSSATGYIGTFTNHPLAFITGDTERARIDTSGNFGIGTTSPPNAKLNIVKASTYSTESAAAIAISSSETSGTASMLLGSDNASAISYIQGVNRGTNWAHNVALNPMGGNVGIGTISPSAKLSVSDSAAPKINFLVGTVERAFISYTESTSIARIDSDAILTLCTNNTESARIDASGNVGIGTASPAYKLQVNGSFAATTKSFVIDHPTKPNHKLRYGSLESPYHGVRLTGEAEVVDGICTVKLPDYIHALCKQEGVNVQLTNIKHSKVLWVDEVDIDNDEFTVATESTGNHKFYWSFTAIRKDIEDMVVEFENNEEEQ